MESKEFEREDKADVTTENTLLITFDDVTEKEKVSHRVLMDIIIELFLWDNDQKQEEAFGMLVNLAIII